MTVPLGRAPGPSIIACADGTITGMTYSRRIAKRLLVSVALGLFVTYACDYLYFRWRLIRARPGDPLETFVAPRLYAIAEKNGKIEYELDAQNPEQRLTCSHSLFPHAGYRPCWYIKPKSQQPIPMSILEPLL
jgi:hypothetical protein